MLESVCNEDDNITFFNYTNTACEKFISGSTTQGLHTVIVRYEESLRKVLMTYQKGNKTYTEVKALVNSQDLLELFFI